MTLGALGTTGSLECRDCRLPSMLEFVADPKSSPKPNAMESGSRSPSTADSKPESVGERYAKGVAEALRRFSLRKQAEQEAQARKARSGG